jgi:murein DD-endopeptidase MepM/ murein hydrolase activator NlpD
MYAHLDDSSLEVQAGQVVSRGQRLGAVLYQDYTGRYPELHPSGDDSHLHYELRDFYNGRNIYSAYPGCNGLIPGRGYTYPENPDDFPSPNTSYTNPDTFIRLAP